MGGYRNTGAGFGGGSPYESEISTGVSQDRFSHTSMGDSGKFAKQFLGAIDRISFNPYSFAGAVYAFAGPALRPRVMEIVDALIQRYAQRYDAGDITAETIKAARLRDAMFTYEDNGF